MLPVLMLTGCATEPAEPKAEGLKTRLASVETQCGVKSGTLRLEAHNMVTLMPSANEKYEAIDCVLRELKKPEFADIKLGFVGNEAYAAEEQK
jgi:hypothetical protein